MNATLAFYNKHADELNLQYSSIPFEQAHGSWEEYWPQPTKRENRLRVLDIGAGTGRDAGWYSKQGYSVVAVEPSIKMLEIGERNTDCLGVEWVMDSLPNLSNLSTRKGAFDYITLSAVWMHLSIEDREVAFGRLVELLAPSGFLVISLRHGGFDDGRENHPVSSLELVTLCRKHPELEICHIGGREDALGRNSVSWQTVVIRALDGE